MIATLACDLDLRHVNVICQVESMENVLGCIFVLLFFFLKMCLDWRKEEESKRKQEKGRERKDQKGRSN